MRGLAHRIVHARLFEYILAALITASAVSLGLSTSPDLLDRFIGVFALFWILTLFVLLLEVLLKMIAFSPRVDQYFRDGWNIFDFLAISSLIVTLFVYADATDYLMLIILVRLLRLLRGLATVEELRLILSTLIRSIPSAGHIVILMSIVLFGYAFVGHRAFGEHDPAHWGNLGVSALSLFQTLTLDDWSGIMGTVIEVQPLAWVYFISFVAISAFIVTNLFIAVVIRNLDEARQERLQVLESPASREEVLRELRSTQQALRSLEARLRQLPD